MAHPARGTAPGAPDPDKGIPDLFSQLFADAKALVRAEARLAKLETGESIGRAGRGALWLALAFAVLVVTLVAVTLFLSTLIGRVANGHYWVGALVTGAAFVVAGALLLKRGLVELSRAPYSMPETRASLTLRREEQL